MARAVFARRYAQAAFELALSTNQLDRWRQDMEGAAQALRPPELMGVLENPKVRLSDKLRLVDLATGDVLPQIRNLVHLIISRGRQNAFDQVVAEFGRLVDAHRGIEHAEVTTAVPLDDSDTKALAQRLKEVLGKEVVLATAIDPHIIGGLVVRVEGKLLDGSSRSQLIALRRTLAEAAG